MEAPLEYKPVSFARKHDNILFITRNMRLVCRMSTNSIPVAHQYAAIFCTNATAKSSTFPLSVREDYEFTHTLVETLVHIFPAGRIIYLRDEEKIYRLMSYPDGSIDPVTSVYN
jgi:hypothetical protein